MLSWKNKIANWIENYVTGSFHDQFEVLCLLLQMIEDDVMTKFEVFCGLELMWKNSFMIPYEVLCGLERMWNETLTNSLK
jgi:hypothetical protein